MTETRVRYQVQRPRESLPNFHRAKTEVEDRPLTPRQLEILKLLALGKTIRETADLLGIAYETVHTTRTMIYLKLGVRTSVMAVVKAARLGLIDLEALE